MKLQKFLLVTLLIIGSDRLFAQSTSTSYTMNPLESNRKKIDSLDQQLIELLGQRELVVKEIGIYKAKNHIPPLQAARFQQVLDKNIAAGKKHDLSPDFVTEVFNAIHKESLRKEEEIKSGHSAQ
ncbi:chorismate mutase [Pedobacter sp. KBS0701]|uniref:chorismate mutase n=1 Tax=Pedobacter sp. KBS0701 TaxID=2578106 RepID=UPI00110F3744|nr:chorismate mutase [Pedobacter sp. KBS0701]QDW26324.1 chorismate mutase [Pedobacter sp. KBS0701]